MNGVPWFRPSKMHKQARGDVFSTVSILWHHDPHLTANSLDSLDQRVEHAVGTSLQLSCYLNRESLWAALSR